MRFGIGEVLRRAADFAARRILFDFIENNLRLKYLLFADDNVYIKGSIADMLISKAAKISVENYAN